jgi:hypothetical protein
MQTLLGCEHGGINESFAELYARTRDRRWLVVAERLYASRKVLDPLTAPRQAAVDPRQHPDSQAHRPGAAARADGQGRRRPWRALLLGNGDDHYSYVIGGNADREYFTAPRTISDTSPSRPARAATPTTC